MAEFQRLSEVAIVEEAPDTSYVLIENEGEVYRAPKTEVGGGGGKTLIVTVSDSGPTANMTYNEAVAAFGAKELIGAFCYFDNDSLAPMFVSTAESGSLRLEIQYNGTTTFIITWTSEGFGGGAPV